MKINKTDLEMDYTSLYLKAFADNFMENFNSTDPCADYPVNDSNGNVPSKGNCSDLDDVFSSNETLIWIPPEDYPVGMGRDFFLYLTPVIFTVGMIGNILSLRVFLAKNMRKLSASVYLAALSTADLSALCFYVLVEWIKRGIPAESGRVTAPFLEQNGVCQILVYLQYISRFLSAWLVACFTLERYIGVCHPLLRRNICDVRSSRKIVLTLTLLAFVICSFKPVLTTVTEIGKYKDPLCTRVPNHAHLSFIFDCIFGISITFLPFLIITFLNALIIRKLFIRNKRHRECQIITEESIIRLEFTIILFAISFFFIAFNMPYSVVWLKQYILAQEITYTDFHQTQNLLLFTRIIFYMNYCVNFFLYSITGAYFRKELAMLFAYKSKAYQNYHRCSVQNTNSNTPQSWL